MCDFIGYLSNELKDNNFIKKKNLSCSLIKNTLNNMNTSLKIKNIYFQI